MITEFQFHFTSCRLIALRRRHEQKLRYPVGLLPSEIDPRLLSPEDTSARAQFSYRSGIDSQRSAGMRYAALIRFVPSGIDLSLQIYLFFFFFVVVTDSIDLNFLTFRSQLQQQIMHESNEKTLQDIVHEEQIPKLFGSFGSIFPTAKASRKLRPLRRSVTKWQVPCAFQIIQNSFKHFHLNQLTKFHFLDVLL